MSKPKIIIIPVGGTITGAAVSPGSATYISGAVHFDSVLSQVQDATTQVDLEVRPFIFDGSPVSLHSSSMTESHLLALTKLINSIFNSESPQGIIVSHGTDTLEETAFFLSLTIQNKPVAIVSAMRPMTYKDSDGPDNLKSAIKYLCSPDNSSLGVVVVSQFKVFSAFNVVKVLSYRPTVTSSSENLPCPFISPHFGEIAVVKKQGPHFQNWNLEFQTPSRFLQEYSRHLHFDISKIELLPTVPILLQHIGHQTPQLLTDFYLKQNPTPKAFILEGNGNGSISKLTLATLTALSEKMDVAFIRASRVPQTWCIDDEANYPSTLGARILTPAQAKIFTQLSLINIKSDFAERIKVAFSKLPNP